MYNNDLQDFLQFVSSSSEQADEYTDKMAMHPDTWTDFDYIVYDMIDHFEKTTSV